MRFLPAAAMLAALLSTLSGGRAPVSAQRYLEVGGDGPSLQLEVTKPFVASDGPFAEASFTTTAWDATVAYPLGSGPVLFARMGLLYASMEGVDASLALTSPRVGVLLASGTGNERAELHVDLPLASEHGATYATGIGIYSSFHEHERFREDTWAVGASASAQLEPGPNAFLGARAGGTVHVPSEGGTDVYALVSLYGDAPTDRTRFRIEFSSRYLVSGDEAIEAALNTEEDLDFSARSTFFASLDVTWPFARFSPTIFARAPIDQTIDATVPIVAGLRLSLGG